MLVEFQRDAGIHTIDFLLLPFFVLRTDNRNSKMPIAPQKYDTLFLNVSEINRTDLSVILSQCDVYKYSTVC
jgi:hypothetical protein